MTSSADVVSAVWRASSASMLGVLARRLGTLDLAEEVLQEALAEALGRWPDEGVPASPAGWLVTTAWRRGVDVLRREALGAAKSAEAAAQPVPEPGADDRLALVFACCHPALATPAQVALTLHAASGLSTEEIAAAFLVPVPTMAQRLVRAKRRLRDAGARFDPPSPAEQAQRLPAVLAVIYLIFNEGYLASGRNQPQRRELAREGLELARQLCAMIPGEPEAAGLAALLEFHEARAATRFDAWGRLVLLEDQDRTRWDHTLIAAAAGRLRAATAAERPGPYQVQAGIAALHALAASFHQTNWTAVRGLYDLLLELAPAPVVALNRAVATRYVDGPAAALAEVDALGDLMSGYRLFHSTRAQLLRALGRPAEAGEATERALALTSNPAERDLLERRRG